MASTSAISSPEKLPLDWGSGSSCRPMPSQPPHRRLRPHGVRQEQHDDGIPLPSIMDHNRLVASGARHDRRCSILAIDPHDEFQTWHSRTGGRGRHPGHRQWLQTRRARKTALVAPFYYLTGRDSPPLRALERPSCDSPARTSPRRTSPACST
jgi:hypothetical protein